MDYRIDVRPRLVDLAVDEALAVKQLAIVPGVDGLAVEIEHENIGRRHRFRRERARDQIAVRVARVAHADMAEGVEHVKLSQRMIRGDEVVDDGSVEPTFWCAAAEWGFRFHCNVKDNIKNLVIISALRQPRVRPIYPSVSAIVVPLADLVFHRGGDATMHLYMQMYLPLLFASCIVTAGYVVAWVLNGGGIDPGPPNARS